MVKVLRRALITGLFTHHSAWWAYIFVRLMVDGEVRLVEPNTLILANEICVAVGLVVWGLVEFVLTFVQDSRAGMVVMPGTGKNGVH